MHFIWHELLYRPLFNALIAIYDLIPSMGLAIILLTIITRLALFPSQAKALRSSKKLQELQPELQKIQEKFKNNKQKQSQAMMEFYQTHKINPLSSCLPTLIQFPIIIALYQVFRTGLNSEKLTELYSFIPKPETINPIFLGYFNLAQPERFILPVLAGITQFIQTKMMMPKTAKKTASSTQEIVSRQMIYFMPIMIVFFAASLPSALPLYWVIVSLFGILQQYLINKEKFSLQRVKVRIKSKK